jgi:hypothetical protein
VKVLRREEENEERVLVGESRRRGECGGFKTRVINYI